jgi:hypothetical protein
MIENQTPVPKWLQALQENSWELELLISGGAVFTLVHAPDLIQDWMIGFKAINNMQGVAVLLIAGILGIKILTNGFILHLFLRSFWLALVCVNYVFPQGINGKKIQLKFPFKASHTEGDLQGQIIKVDRLSGLVIFMSILGTIVLVGLTILIFSFLTLTLNLEQLLNPNLGSVISFAALTLIALYIVDLISNGFFRKIPILSYVLYPFFILFDFATLRPFYSRAMALFSSNVKQWSFRLGALIFTAVTLASSFQSLNHFLHHKSFFDNRAYTDKISKNKSMADWKYADRMSNSYSTAYIPSKIIENNFLTVNVGYKPWMDELIGASSKVDSLKYVERIFEVSIDDSVYANIKWHALHKIDLPSIGLEGLVNITNLSNGEHELKISFKDFPEPEYRKLVAEDYDFPVNIPFCKDVF